jgi:hypothetical protein
VRWPWRRRTTGELKVPNRRDEAARQEEARQELERVRARWPAVTQLAAALRGHRAENNFAERIRRAAGGE